MTKRSAEERRRLIADHVVEQGTATGAALARLTGVSLMTVHRDLDDLARQGVLRRFRGGASALPSTVFESSLDYRLGVNTAEKKAVARAAAALVEPGMSVMLDDSTTVLVMAGLLVDLAPLTVVTNARRVLDVFAGCEGIRLIALGGEYSRTHDSFLGMPCVEAVEALSVDLVAVSTSALDARTAYHQEQDVVLVKRAMLTSAATKVMLMDHTKLARTALHRVGPVGDLDHLVVDDGADAELLGKLRERTRVTVATVAS
ncbi:MULTISPECIES: DeoR/GlpR family DNA-binding transcription regulator [Streptomyces]|uniref:DeoR/GlpR family DNA-binding transcription regulator n=1 Tax=Streptomyces TaxID=1883 RepID=UPI00081F6F6E|nr:MULTISPECIES: DeoR/GlpR family DNA-binding transcription regulator [Streptomyces]PVC76987.1 DeoR/GlpR transcriptional regulator [Streptomyces sp. CS131]GGS46168.1 DeoR family transcriptional regulator [Streptomyces parvus]SCF57415.1 transcriptional regulator, DeoR family [Streptomyces sp. Cmuel-A718b]